MMRQDHRLYVKFPAGTANFLLDMIEATEQDYGWERIEGEMMTEGLSVFDLETGIFLPLPLEEETAWALQWLKEQVEKANLSQHN